MATLTESATWRSHIYQLDTTDPDLAGEVTFAGDGVTPLTGHLNAQAKLLGDRTQYLKQQIESVVDDSTNKVTGPASSVNNEVVLFDGANGKVIKGGGLLGTAAFTSSDDYATPTEVSDSLQEAKDYTDLKIQENSVDAVLAGMVADDVGYITSNTAILQSLIDAGKPIYLPQGIYYVDFLTFPASLVMYGDGQNKSILSWPQANMTTRGNMFVASGDVDNLILRNIGFRGNRPFQTTPTVSGHDTVAFFLRGGSVQNVNIEACAFTDFGDGVATGAGILIGSLTGTNKVIRNIRVTDSNFTNISNVPGIYINGDATYHSSISDIFINQNIFTCEVNAAQNCVYVLGGNSTIQAQRVNICDNHFRITASIDVCIETNYIDTFSINGNNVVVSGTGSATGVLIREYAIRGTISNNVLTNLSSSNSNTHAIALVRISAGGTQMYISITANVIYAWGVTGTSGGAIIVSAGSSYIDISSNLIMGIAATAGNRIRVAIEVSSSIRVDILDNRIHACTYILTLGDGINALRVEGNSFTNVGDGAVAAIVDNVANQTMANMIYRNNTLLGIVAGTPSLISLSPSANTGNRVENNILPAGVSPINPALISKFVAIVTPASTGALLAGTSYTFSQGSLSIADADGFTIGANLDGTLSGQGVALGDTIVVSANVSMKGCLVYGYVDSVDVIRIRVQNETGSSVSIDAGTWKVIVIKG